MLALQKIRNPKQIEPPHWIGNKLRQHERPGLAMREQPRPAHTHLRSDRIAANVCELRGRARLMLLRRTVKPQPHRKPAETRRDQTKNRRAPSPMHSNAWSGQRSNNRPEFTSRIKDARCQ